MRKYAANFVPVTCIGSLALTEVYGLYVLKGLIPPDRQDENPTLNPFTQVGKTRSYIKSIKTSGGSYRVRLTDGIDDFTCILSPHDSAILALPNHMLGLKHEDFLARRPTTRAVPQHHIDEAVAANWGGCAFGVVIILGAIGFLSTI